jgi:hypothetical protein
MKKKNLMIGNTDNLPGVPIDISGFYDFFASPIGGNWCSEEMDILLNPPLHSLLQKIEAIANADNDFVITIFSGHGGEAYNGTVLSINGRGEKVMMQTLMNLAPKQLHIFDCCRSPMPRPIDFSFRKTRATKRSMFRDPIRRAYEARIRVALPQEVFLFACDEGEAAKDTADGFYSYSQYLLHAAQTAATDSNSPFVTVSEAHDLAVSMMREDDPSTIRHPQIYSRVIPPRRELPLAVNVGWW